MPLLFTDYKIKFSHDEGHMGLDARKPVFEGFANNKGADQPAHPRSLISAFVIRFLEISYIILLQVKIQFSS